MQIRKYMIFPVLLVLSFCVRFRTVDPPSTKLILMISIDQMRYDYLTRFAPLYVGGFKRLLEKGAVFTNAKYRHALTETAPGHSTMASGRHPSHSGIIENDWYDRYLRKLVNVVEDPLHDAVGGRGTGASPHHLIGYTIGDWIKKRNPRSKVVSVSLKDRSAVLMAGHLADAVFWYEPSEGKFLTSNYYMNELPDWLAAWNQKKEADRYANLPWTRLKEKSIYDQYAGRDDVEGEWDRKDVVFPHWLRGKPPEPEYYRDLRRFPFADQLTVRIVLEMINRYSIGSDSAVDVFALSLSATDVIGHIYGPDSHEILDQMLRLDLLMEQLFQEVDNRVGMNHVIVVLSADHGVMPLVELNQAQGARRIHPEFLLTRAKEALNRKFRNGSDFILYYDAPHFYLDESKIQRAHLTRSKVSSEILSALMATNTIEAGYTGEQLSNEISGGDPYYFLMKNSYYAPRSPDLLILLKKYIYMDVYPGGTTHGSPYDYDRHVPIIFMGPGIRAGTYHEDCGPEDIAPTIAKMLGLDFPREQDSRLLTEMFIK